MFSNALAKWVSALCLLGACVALAQTNTPSPTPVRGALPLPLPWRDSEGLEPFDGIEELRSKLYLYTDGGGHYLALAETVNQLVPKPVFWGDGNAFFAQRLLGGHAEKQSGTAQGTPDVFLKFNIMFLDLRTKLFANEIVKKESGEFYIACTGRRKNLKPVPTEEAKAIVKRAKFYKRRFMRAPHLLVRDDTGTYYYVDKSDKEGELDFQFFIGPRGRLRQTKLRNIVQDREGEIFATPDGSLRIIVDSDRNKNRDEAYWMQASKKQPLVSVPIDMPFVFGELGMYARQKLGTPCDDI